MAKGKEVDNMAKGKEIPGWVLPVGVGGGILVVGGYLAYSVFKGVGDFFKPVGDAFNNAWKSISSIGAPKKPWETLNISEAEYKQLMTKTTTLKIPDIFIPPPPPVKTGGPFRVQIIKNNNIVETSNWYDNLIDAAHYAWGSSYAKGSGNIASNWPKGTTYQILNKAGKKVMSPGFVDAEYTSQLSGLYKAAFYGLLDQINSMIPLATSPTDLYHLYNAAYYCHQGLGYLER